MHCMRNGKQYEKQYVRRWVAGGLCLLMLWRPLRADGGGMLLLEPSVEMRGLAAQEETEAPARGDGAPAEPAPPAGGEQPPAQDQVAPDAPAPATQEPSTPAPSGEAGGADDGSASGGNAEGGEQAGGASATDAPRNAQEDSSFSRGYVVALSGGEARFRAHTRKSSPPVIRIGAGELLLVTGRVKYQATRKERKEAEKSGQVFDDWFAVRVRDAQGQIVEGYLPGRMLQPMTAEETKEMREQWEEAAEEARKKDSEAEFPQLADGIPVVGGSYLPPPKDEDTDSPEDTEQPTPVITEAPADTDQPSADPAEPTPGASQEPGEGIGVGESTDGEPGEGASGDTAEVPGEGEDADSPDPADPTDPNEPVDPEAPLNPEEPLDPEAPLDPVQEALLRAETLIAENEGFFEATQALMEAMGDEGPGEDVYAPTIGGVQISYALETPVLSARLLVNAFDEQDPVNPTNLIAGIARVYVECPDSVSRNCTYDSAAQRYVLTVYRGGTYIVHVIDAAGNESTRTVTVDTSVLDGANETDSIPPEIGTITQTPSDKKDIVIAISAQPVDNAAPGEVASGVAEAWLEITIEGELVRIPCAVNPENPLEYIGQVYENGTYTLCVQDAAGNVAQQSVVVTNILPLDTYAPKIESIIVDPPDDGEHLVPGVSVYVAARDKRKPNTEERVTGVAKVEIGFYYGLDAAGNIKAVDLVEMYPTEPNNFAAYIEENGAYVIVATDNAGNVRMQELNITHIGEEKPRKRDPNWEFRPIDDDGDGLYTQTEYRLGSNPANRDTSGDGLWDGLCVRLGLDVGGLNAAPKPSVLSQAKDASMLDALVAAGTLDAPLSEARPGVFRHRFSQDWRKQRNHVVWMHPQSNTLLALNNTALFAAQVPRSEQVDIERALSLELLGYGGAGSLFRTLAPCADGSLVLLYDRKVEGGPLTKDAYLIDTQRMAAYRVPDTKDARGLALSDDGGVLAVWRTGSLERIDLRTGKVLRIDDAERCARIEMLNFLPDNRLVTRVNSIGYSAVQADGSPEVGSASAMPCLTQFQDLTGLTVFDRNMTPLRVNLELYLGSSGLFLKGEAPEAETVRNLSPRALYERSISAQAAR